jgi:hypothetical protein
MFLEIPVLGFELTHLRVRIGCVIQSTCLLFSLLQTVPFSFLFVTVDLVQDMQTCSEIHSVLSPVRT